MAFEFNDGFVEFVLLVMDLGDSLLELSYFLFVISLHLGEFIQGVGSFVGVMGRFLLLVLFESLGLSELES